MKKLFHKLTMLSVFALLTIAPLALTPGSASAALSPSTKQAACDGIAVDGATCDGSSGGGIADLITSAISILSWVVGITAVIMLIVGGLRYVLSNGDANAISGAKNTILYAIIGLVIAVLAQAIVQFVLKNLTS